MSFRLAGNPAQPPGDFLQPVLRSAKRLAIWRDWLPPAILSIALICLSFYAYLLFHTLAELVAVVVGVCLFVLALATHSLTRNHFLLFLGCGYFWIAGLDLLHTLTFKGMGTLPGAGADPPTQLWVATRFLEALVLVTAPLFLTRSLRALPVFAGFGLIALVVTVAVLGGRFPAAFVEGQGLTPFKIGAEYVIIALLALALAHLLHRHRHLPRQLAWPMAGAILLTMAAELCFTLYVEVDGPANMAGHVLKFLSFWLLLVAVVRLGLGQPALLIARSAFTFDAVPDPTLMIDRRGRILQANPAAGREMGGRAANLIGQALHGHWRLNHKDPAACPVCRALAEGTPLQAAEIADSDRQRYYQVTLTPMPHDPARNLWVLTLHDVTAAHRREAELAEKSRQLAASNRELTQFAYVASHDLREPLRTIRSFIALLRRRHGDRLDAEGQEFLGLVEDGAGRMQQLIDDLLAYSRVTTHGRPLAPVPLDPVIDDVVADLSAAIADSGAILHRPPVLPRVLGDAAQLRRLFQNLFANAIKYGAGDEPPDITLTVARDEDGPWHLIVRDRGPGIAEDDRERVFQVFQRGRNAGGHEGTGIGLAVARRIVERHGGRMWVDNAGPGAAFHFTLAAP